jgi:hypothetical protein
MKKQIDLQMFIPIPVLIPDAGRIVKYMLSANYSINAQIQLIFINAAY